MAHRILVPFDLPDAKPVSRLLIEDLAGMEAVLLGHYGLPEQTPPDAARDQFEAEAQSELDALAAEFVEAGVDVTTRLMFGQDRLKAIDQVADEEDCDAELDPAPTTGIERILVPLRDTRNLDRLADFVRILSENATATVTLFHVLMEGKDVTEAEAMLEEARDTMVERGFDPEVLDLAVAESGGRDERILGKAEDYDAVVMHEPGSDITALVLGTLPNRIARRTGSPVILVRQRD